MENNENFVTEQVAENVEETTEQTPKMFTQDEVNEIVGKSKARERAKITKQYDREYGQLVEVLEAGTGKKGVGALKDAFTDFYGKKGMLPQKPEYSERDLDTLAKADAEEIIRSGYEDVVEEVDRLADIGFDNMTAREKRLFKTLAEHRQNEERGRALSERGVTADVYNSTQFREFASKFSATTPITDIYDIYEKTQPKPNIKPMGSMRSNSTTDNGVKDFYTPEEARKFTAKELRENPALEQKIIESISKWGKR
jgi:hypothetical protein